ncbi:2,3-diphosphoglycerate-dependent phosphoglycerate mutase [Picrophilus oshimae]|uniref:Phosphoglycerate mutase n=1 Tax=Picrophilus torridus (strain ATCC 700027 / DSM 9790 / JCM 10055 / NBRC 100828 / KAW 2/3) TaxID=1122961 RepID=Q6KZ21_PICTO|nr:2,3-diphosphoglycerate-dependent phosphoglycerate mutase [Picrophilus oshimae]AAT44031.1 phosphoglycerate mutase family protein [Picrophilus oshimae DSM 9789]SMD30898.1 phosphoglycerate mutase [Picrophilus oshimae DSM 9789]
MRAILIRHGESDINIAGLLSHDIDNNKLTERGIKQVERTAEQLIGLKIDRIVSSPVKRAAQTADIIGKIINVNVVYDDRLKEIDLGSANNHHVSEYRDELYPNAHIHGDLRNDLGFEPWDHLIKRMIDSLLSYDGNNIFVSHSDPIRAAASYYLNIDEPCSFGIDIKNASMTVIDIDNKKLLCLGAIYLDDGIKKMFS